jgi:hypothetical protein
MRLASGVVAAVSGGLFVGQSDSDTERYIFLDPDGTKGVGLVVIVMAPTGVIYGHQCAGLNNEQRTAEGFAVPLGGAAPAQPLLGFFRETFHGNPPAMDESLDARLGAQWSEEALDELATLVGAIPFWKTYPESAGREDQRTFLELDRARLSELTEAWIPVTTAYGPGVLIFDNSD